MANDIIQQVLGQYQAYVDFAEDGRWAYRFLVVAHQRSGLFIETQPGIYAFSHQNFREYLAATALIDRRDADMLALVQRHAADPSTNWVGCPPISTPGSIAPPPPTTARICWFPSTPLLVVRLPTEEEWERLAGGVADKNRFAGTHQGDRQRNTRMRFWRAQT